MNTPDWISGNPADLRRWRDSRQEVLHPVLPLDVQMTPVAAAEGHLGGLMFEPATKGAEEIVYFHGGGFVVGSPQTHRLIAAWIAHLTGSRVYSARYRLGPEFTLPSQVEDAVAAIRFQLSHSGTLRLAGDSAGALVALWGFAALDPTERARISGVILNYPTAGLVPAPGDGDAALETDGLGPQSIAAMFRRIDPEGLMWGDAALDPLAPGFAFPPNLTILAAEDDPLLGDSLALAVAARSAGRQVRLTTAEGQQHGFLSALPAEPALGYLRGAFGLGAGT